MKKLIRQIDNDKKILQVTTIDERWYAIQGEDTKTGLPIYKYYPSVTWITDHYPKGIGFYKWLANHGWDEAQGLKEAAADKGSRVHKCIEYLIEGETIKHDDKYKDANDEEKELTIEEYECILSFKKWVDDAKPEFLAKEIVTVSNEYNYAGMIDIVAKVDGQRYIIDLKTSQNVWPSHRLQVSAYNKSFGGENKLAILQIGYRRNKDQYKFNEIDDCFDLFLAARQIWEAENKDTEPKQRDYPLEVKL
jgi:hypothetical protein